MSMTVLRHFVATGEVLSLERLRAECIHAARSLDVALGCISGSVEHIEEGVNGAMDGDDESEHRRWYATGYAHGRAWSSNQMGHAYNAAVIHATRVPK